MAIHFDCSGCGKSYKVGEEKAGKRFKCSQCQTVGLIPSAGEGAALQGAACPGCGVTMAPGAVICVQCGYGVPQGEARQAVAAAEAPRPEARRDIVLPWGKIIAAGVLVIVLLLGWLLVVRPAKAGSAIDDALAAAGKGHYKEAREQLEAVQRKASGSQKERVERLIAIMRLEEDLRHSNRATDTVVLSYGPGKKPGEKTSRLLLEVSIENKSAQPIVLHSDCFYLSNGSEAVFSGGRNEGFPGGTTVPPGGKGGGVLGFYRIPGSSVGLIVSDLYTSRYLVYNDGKNYAGTLLNLSVILGGEALGEGGEAAAVGLPEQREPEAD